MLNVSCLGVVDPRNLEINPSLHLGNLGDPVRDLEALKLGDNPCSLDVLIKVDELLGRSFGGDGSFRRVSDINKGELQWY